ncbi:heavy metal translocating P-type ATPase [Variovorax dokdonensis]|uniref:P-type Zn(2+) transporter n=1 Tax=Variovorax dokdonensis TaxID=344883 RepID=A0ABT7NEB2_9BURK|nr:heavy metal translocating P-type ATPase [Variovorax dokdonensis]MDM0046289.1 heavy metal translocating P-type ATPase [Variovorax dokdonensis]
MERNLNTQAAAAQGSQPPMGAPRIKIDCCGSASCSSAPTHAHADGHDHGRADGNHAQTEEAGHDHGPLPSTARLIAALCLALGAEGINWFAADRLPWEIAGMVVAAVAIVLAGLGIYVSGLRSLRRGKLGIDTLMSVAVTGAFVIGQWPEAAMVMALYALAELIEHRAADRARNAIAGLMALAPQEAEWQRADGRWERGPSSEVPMSARVRVRPGERLPFDGEVVLGHGAIDQSPITGESIPVDKGVGDKVFAGTINQSGELQFTVTASAGSTTLDRIIHAVEQAQGSRSPTQRMVDRFAAVYTPAVFALAVALVLVMPLAFGWTWLDAIYRALVLLVIACPCALVLATPVTVVSALTSAARRGILIKGGVHLEAARTLKAIALDKTGTLTEGKPSLVHWQAWAGADAQQVERAAAALTTRSDHPVSKAILAGLQPAGELPDVESFRALPGRGTEGRVQGRALALGNHRLIEERGQCGPELEALLAEQEQQGRSVSLLADESGVIGIFAVADTLKPHAQEAVAALQALGVTPVMLSGDNQTTATAVAAQAGIQEVRGNLLPEEKQQALLELQARHGPTGMTGDGINDAPALAQARLGFAMGRAGTDIAMETADVVIMNDDLRRLPETVALSRRTHAVLWQNIVIALGIKAVFMVLAVAGSATLWMAVFADVGASLLVIANGLRLLRMGER